VSPSASEKFATSIANRRLLELVMILLSCVVIVAGVATILVAAEKERRISALKSEFVANVSHELKTPLALIRMFGEMLQTGRVASDAKRDEYLKIIVDESERLSNLIENVLDFARVERGRDAYDFAEGDVAEAVTRAAAVYRHRAEKEGVELVVEVERPLPASRIDERAIQLAVINLIDNALKYAHHGKTVIVKAGREGRYNVIRVIDRGPGVPPEDRERIFERFVRGTITAENGENGASRSPSRGSGIGLALVKHIAESHGGRAWVEARAARQDASTGDESRAPRVGGSTANSGSAFLLSIPA